MVDSGGILWWILVVYCGGFWWHIVLIGDRDLGL